jgi:hypothetical protein
MPIRITRRAHAGSARWRPCAADLTGGLDARAVVQPMRAARWARPCARAVSTASARRADQLRGPPDADRSKGEYICYVRVPALRRHFHWPPVEPWPAPPRHLGVPGYRRSAVPIRWRHKPRWPSRIILATDSHDPGDRVASTRRLFSKPGTRRMADFTAIESHDPGTATSGEPRWAPERPDFISAGRLFLSRLEFHPILNTNI